MIIQHYYVFNVIESTVTLNDIISFFFSSLILPADTFLLKLSEKRTKKRKHDSNNVLL